jgi:exodeoxyribonuclease VII small subunit
MTDDGRTYEQLLADLEGLVTKMATGGLGIEEATALFEEATRLHALATERLKAIEARIDALAPPPSDD